MAKNQNKKPASIQDFKKKSRASAILDLPSGATIEVKNPGGMKMFMTGGVIPNSLMGIVQKALDTGQTDKVEDDINGIIRNEEGEVDPAMIADLMGMIDNVTVNCWVMPPVLPVPENEADKDPELLYVDEVMEEDKMFVFQWAVGGTKDLEQFRREHQESLGRLAGSSNMEGSA